MVECKACGKAATPNVWRSKFPACQTCFDLGKLLFDIKVQARFPDDDVAVPKHMMAECKTCHNQRAVNSNGFCSPCAKTSSSVMAVLLGKSKPVLEKCCMCRKNVKSGDICITEIGRICTKCFAKDDEVLDLEMSNAPVKAGKQGDDKDSVMVAKRVRLCCVCVSKKTRACADAL